MDTLFNIFQREKKRVGDRFKVSYNSQKNSLQYFNSGGTLTVVFDAEKGSEDFYFIYPGGAFRHFVKQIRCYGHVGEYTDELSRIPQEFIDLTEDYMSSHRKFIGVEKPTDDIQSVVDVFKGPIKQITPEEVEEAIEKCELAKKLEALDRLEELIEDLKDIIFAKDVTNHLDEASFEDSD